MAMSTAWGNHPQFANCRVRMFVEPLDGESPAYEIVFPRTSVELEFTWQPDYTGSYVGGAAAQYLFVKNTNELHAVFKSTEQYIITEHKPTPNVDLMDM